MVPDHHVPGKGVGVRPGYEAWTPALRSIYGAGGLLLIVFGIALAFGERRSWWLGAGVAFMGACQVLGAIWPVILGKPLFRNR